MAIKLSKIKINRKNPRFIRDEAFERLCGKIKRNPAGMKVRPIVIESWANPVIIAGNQRYRALKTLGYKEVPDEWIQSAEDWTEEQRREFLVTDNISDGEWEWDMLNQDYSAEELNEWGLDMNEPADEHPAIGEIKKQELKGFKRTHVLLSFHPELLIELQPHLEAIFNIPGIEYEQGSN